MVSIGRIYRDRLSIAAIGLAACLVLGAAPVQTSSKPQGAPEAALARSKSDGDGRKAPSAYERESLAIDRAANGIGERANSIADAQRVYGLLQLVLGVFGVAFTGVAAFFAYRATHWAKAAAQAARESANSDNQALAETRAAGEDQRKAAVQQAKWSNEQLGLMDQTMQFTAESARAMKDVARSMAASAKQVADSIAVSKSVAKSQQLFGKTQLRAYVAVLIGGAIYQDATGLRFEAKPSVVNTGHTFARNVRWRIDAAVLPVPLPDDFRFPLGPVREGSTLLPPGQSVTISAIVNGVVPAEDIDRAKSGIGLSLYVWGVLSYQDIFKRTHRTTFAQQLWWRKVGEQAEDGLFPEVIEGWYLAQHNKAN